MAFLKDVEISRPNDCNGFDIVIGNPPYIEAKKLKHIASSLKNYCVASGTADLSIYFIEKAFSLCSENGKISFITTNKFFNTGFGRLLRKFLLEKEITHLIDFEQCEVFEDVLVSSVILSVKNTLAPTGNKFLFHRFVKLNHTEFKEMFLKHQKYFETFLQDNLDENEWSFATGEKAEIKSKLEKFSKIKCLDGVHVYRGVTTGYNPAFIISNEQREALIKADKKNADVIKNMLQGRNIRKWYYNESDENLIFTRRGFDIKNYPFIEKHLKCFYNQLKPKKKSTDIEGRKPGIYKWFEILDNTAYYPHFEKSEKIIWGLTADKWAFALDTKQHYLPSNGYIMTSEKLPIKYLLGLLNSKVLHFYFGFIGVMTAGGAYTLKAATIEALPIPPAIPEQQQSIIALVDKILAAKKVNPLADTCTEEAEIDRLVYKLYGLTEEEIVIIERN